MSSLRSRITRLEVLARAGTCQTCYDWPVRMTTVDPETGILLDESLPETGCPDCGRPIRHERVLVVAATLDELFA